jgi:polar amino acid transport system substrate-binding protein/cystine transport system substrate-binding protein/membrane-bound lytic murein transglycosylase F
VITAMLAANALPPDTSLAEVREGGRLVACLPDRYPPLVTGDPEAPGFDVEALEAVAERLGVTLAVSTNSAMGRDFNPRNWRVSRAQCHVLGGGVVLSRETRSFMDTVAGPVTTGWVSVHSGAPGPLEAGPVAVYPGTSGLDRLALGRYLRSSGIDAEVHTSLDGFEAALASGEAAAGVTEALVARGLPGEGWTVRWMPEPFEPLRYGFGLWRGDVTLLRAFERALVALEADGTLDRIAARYGLAPVEVASAGAGP